MGGPDGPHPLAGAAPVCHVAVLQGRPSESPLESVPGTAASLTPRSSPPSEQLLIRYRPLFAPRMTAPGGQELCLARAGARQTRVE